MGTTILSFQNRVVIETLHSEGRSLRYIANYLGFPELFTRNSKIPIKHMIQVLDGDFAFSPFKCRKRASALV